MFYDAVSVFGRHLNPQAWWKISEIPKEKSRWVGQMLERCGYFPIQNSSSVMNWLWYLCFPVFFCKLKLISRRRCEMWWIEQKIRLAKRCGAAHNDDLRFLGITGGGGSPKNIARPLHGHRLLQSPRPGPESGTLPRGFSPCNSHYAYECEQKNNVSLLPACKHDFSESSL